MTSTPFATLKDENAFQQVKPAIDSYCTLLSPPSSLDLTDDGMSFRIVEMRRTLSSLSSASEDHHPRSLNKIISWHHSRRVVHEDSKGSPPLASWSFDSLDSSRESTAGPPADLHLLPPLEKFKVTQPSKGYKHPQRQFVVVLIGWMDGNDSYLEKYAMMYHGMGADVVLRRTVRLHEVIGPTFRSFETSAKELVQNLPIRFPNATVIMHVFSGGGCTFYWRLLRMLKEGNHPIDQVKGLLFDSGPTSPKPHSVARAVRAVISNSIAKQLAYGFIRLTAEIQQAIAGRPLRDYIRDQAHYGLDIPTLFLYSKADHISKPKVIEKMIKERRAAVVERGHEADLISSYCFEDSAHVCHYRKYPAQYKELICRFLAHQDINLC